MRFRTVAVLGLLAVLTTRPQARADEVKVAVAANFAAPIQRIAADFEQATGHKLLISLGSTGKFHAQIRNGAPFEVLLAADQETPRKLEAEGLAVPGSRFTYATGRLVLWSRDAGRVDAEGQVLRTGHFERLAIADPRLAPYGAAAAAVIDKLGLKDALAARLVQGDSIGQAHQFVASGHAELGFVALAQVQLDGRLTGGSAWRVPEALHAPLHQDAVLLRPGADRPAARALLDHLRSVRLTPLIESYGYAR